MKFDGHHPFFFLLSFLEQNAPIAQCLSHRERHCHRFLFLCNFRAVLQFSISFLKNNNFMTKLTYVVEIELTRTYRITCDRHGVTFGRCGPDVIKHKKPLKLLSNHSSFLELRGGISSNQLVDH